MQRIKLVGLALVAVCAMSVTMAASAGAHTFLSSGTGSLTGKVTETQKFKTAAGTVECTALTVSGSVTTTKTEKQKATVQYTGCKAFGLAATISPAQYEFNANGTVNILATITIKATACTVTVPSAKNQGLSTVKYANSGGQIEIQPNVGGITSVGTGTACTYAEESKGTYTGNSKAGLVGGTIDWA